MSEIGTKRVLWREYYDLHAYRDQLGKWQAGYVVAEEFVVTITEEKSVRGTWGNDTYTGWKAVAEDGREFTCNWFSFHDDSPMPTYYWDIVQEADGDLWQPVDAMQAEIFQAHVTKDGKKALPVGSLTCETHDKIYLESDGCWMCEYEEENAK